MVGRISMSVAGRPVRTMCDNKSNWLVYAVGRFRAASPTTGIP
jgi:hypothetical protein